MTDAEYFRLEVVAGKDTIGECEQGKHHEGWLPRNVEVTINRYV